MQAYVLTIKQKNELLDKLEKGVPVVNLVAEYGVAKLTIGDIRLNKEKIRAYADQMRSEQGVSDPNYSRKKLTTGHFVELSKQFLSGIASRKRWGLLCGGVKLRMLHIVSQFR